MPVNYAKISDTYEKALVEALMFGSSTTNRWVKLQPDGKFNNYEDARPMWDKHKRKIMQEFAKRYPGKKPFAYDIFEQSNND